jgi:hypothetical protein
MGPHSVYENEDFPDQIFGITWSAILYSESPLRKTHHYECPDDLYTKLGWYKSNELAFMLKYGMTFLPSNKVGIYGIGGISVYGEVLVTRSDATGDLYEQEIEEEIVPLYGVGAAYIFNDCVIMLEADNRRGVSIMFGISPFLILPSGK